MDEQTQTWTVEVTGEQAHVLASWISMMIQLHLEKDDENHSQEAHEEMETLAPVGKRCADIASEAGEWPGDETKL